MAAASPVSPSKELNADPLRDKKGQMRFWEHMNINNKSYALIAGVLLLGAGLVIYWLGFPNPNTDATRLSAIVIVGLALTVVFMAVLALIYSVMGVENGDQALGLPEGSVRALLAFSLVLIFVCLGAFLFGEVNKNGSSSPSSGNAMSRVTDNQLVDLKSNFLVAAELAKDTNGKVLYEQVPDTRDKEGKATMDDLKHPLYSVTYYPKPNRDADDLAKQIFTTLATVFVSVVSFYFGSSVTSSGVGVGAKTAVQTPDRNTKLNSLRNALTTALADSHNAQFELDDANRQLDTAKAAAEQDPTNSEKQGSVLAAQKVVEESKQSLVDKQKRVVDAQKALSDANQSAKVT